MALAFAGGSPPPVPGPSLREHLQVFRTLYRFNRRLGTPRLQAAAEAAWVVTGWRGFLIFSPTRHV